MADIFDFLAAYFWNGAKKSRNSFAHKLAYMEPKFFQNGVQESDVYPIF